MKRRNPQTLLSRFLRPTILLILLPFLICITFYFLAMLVGSKDALENLQYQNSGLLQTIENSLVSDPELENETPIPTSGMPDRSGDERFTTPDRQCLPPYLDDAINSYETLSNAGFIILSGDFELLYPSSKHSSATYKMLAEDFEKALKSNGFTEDKPFTASSGAKYLVNVLSPGESEEGIAFVIAFYPLSLVTGWIRPVTNTLLIISSVISLFVLLQLFFSVKKTDDQLRRLCFEAEKLSTGTIENISSEFDLTELEELRVSMDNMASELDLLQKKREDMVSNAAHKLQNRCMIISGYVQGLMNGFISPDKAGRFIQKETEALSEDVKNIRSFVTLDNRNAPVLQERVPVTEMLENCADRISAIAVKKGVFIHMEKNAGELFVLGNEDYIEEILDNLFSNAVRHAKKEVVLSVRTEADKAVITVADDGEGIREEDLPHIFERFYKGPDGNFGLGLPIARSAAEQMGGSLTAKNRPEGGAVFTLSLKKDNSRQ